MFSLQEKFAGVDIRVRVNGGGHVSQIYAIRQAISKALVAYYQKCKCELEKYHFVGRFESNFLSTRIEIRNSIRISTINRK